MRAREQGVEAYFLHRGNLSYVTVGAWPRSAVRESRTSAELLEERVANDYDPPPVVMSPGGRLPERFRNLTDERWRRAVAMEVQIEIADPTLLATIKRYDYVVDGYVDQAEPLLVPVPKALGRRAAEELDAAAKRPPQARDLDALLDRPPGL